MIAVEDVAASHRLGDLVRTLGFEIDFEQVPQDEPYDLNREGLIVICGPRINADVGAVLATDPVLRFNRLSTGWALEDHSTGKTYISGQDDTPPRNTDVAYLGRLNRPDGDGTVIIFTGIHPQGTLGVVQLLINDLSDLYRQAGTDAFSTLVEVEYDPKTNESTAIELATPIYHHEGMSR